MKPATFFSFLLFFSVTLYTPKLYAQEVPYTPFLPAHNLVWSVWGYNHLNNTYCGMHYGIDSSYVFIVDDKIYTAVYLNSSYPFGIREENKKIYFVLPKDTNYVEHILYDFNLDVGDTIFYDIALCYYVRDNMIEFHFFSMEHYAVVKEKGSITLKDGSVRNTISAGYFIWIEGLGGTSIGLFDPLNVEYVLDGSCVNLICIYYEEDYFFNNCLYSSEGNPFAPPPAGFCPCMPNAVIENAKNKITVLPNPTTGELRVESGELRVENVEIFDIYGKKQSSNHLITSSSNHLINISHLPAGLYFFKITTENGVFVEKVVKD